MARDFRLYQYEEGHFEALVTKLCVRWLGEGVVAFAPGKDGGRDGRFEGKAQEFPSAADPISGKCILQAKHTANPVASCSDSDFDRIMNNEKPRITVLIQNGEVDHYLLFTNRKLTANRDAELRTTLLVLGLKTAHIVGVETLHQRLDLDVKLLETLNIPTFDHPIRFDPSDLVDVVTAFHCAHAAIEHSFDTQTVFDYVPKKTVKNVVNGLSLAYWDFVVSNSMPHFDTITVFLKNPRNAEYRDYYKDSVNSLKQWIILHRAEFPTFDAVLTDIYERVVQNTPALRRKKRFVLIFLHYMYFDCDIGDHAPAVQAS